MGFYKSVRIWRQRATFPQSVGTSSLPKQDASSTIANGACCSPGTGTSNVVQGKQKENGCAGCTEMLSERPIDQTERVRLGSIAAGFSWSSRDILESIQHNGPARWGRGIREELVVVWRPQLGEDNTIRARRGCEAEFHYPVTLQGSSVCWEISIYVSCTAERLREIIVKKFWHIFSITHWITLQLFSVLFTCTYKRLLWWLVF